MFVRGSSSRNIATGQHLLIKQMNSKNKKLNSDYLFIFLIHCPLNELSIIKYKHHNDSVDVYEKQCIIKEDFLYWLFLLSNDIRVQCKTIANEHFILKREIIIFSHSLILMLINLLGKNSYKRASSINVINGTICDT